MVGKEFDERMQTELYQKLVENGVVTPKDGVLPRATTQAINGRKWAAAFNHLGLAIAWKSKGEARLKPPGIALLDGSYLPEEVFLRQLLKWQLPSPIDQRGTSQAGFCIQPLRFVIKVMSSLRERHAGGLSKEEIALFIVTTIRNEEWESVVDEIESYRLQRGELEGLVRKKRYFGCRVYEKCQELYGEKVEPRRQALTKLASLRTGEDVDPLVLDELLKEITRGGKGPNTKQALYLRARVKSMIGQGKSVDETYQVVVDHLSATKKGTLLDYADSMVRYFRQTGLFSVSGSRFILRESRLSLIEALASEDFCMLGSHEFECAFYDMTRPQLPSDNLQFAVKNVKSLYNKRNTLRLDLGMDAFSKPPQPTSTSEARRMQSCLEDDILYLKEQLFYLEQQTSEGMDDIERCFAELQSNSGGLLGGVSYRPAYFEWATWRVFLALDSLGCPVGKTRGFDIDDEINPVHHAPGGRPDITLEYDDFVLVVEVSLTTGANQWSAEGEPVPRHVAHVMKGFSKPVFGLFVAPKIDDNTAEQFFGRPFWLESRPLIPKIIPITTTELLTILTLYRTTRFGVDTLHSMLEEWWKLQDEASHGPDWRRRVSLNIESKSAMIMGG